MEYGDIRGFKPSIDSMSGTVNWNNGEDWGKLIYATPNWEREGVCPVSIYHEDGEYQDVAILKFTDMSKIQQKEYYLNVVADVIDSFLEKR